MSIENERGIYVDLSKFAGLDTTDMTPTFDLGGIMLPGTMTISGFDDYATPPPLPFAPGVKLEIAPAGMRWPWRPLYVGTASSALIGHDGSVDISAANGLTKRRVGIRRWARHHARRVHQMRTTR